MDLLTNELDDLEFIEEFTYIKKPKSDDPIEWLHEAQANAMIESEICEEASNQGRQDVLELCLIIGYPLTVNTVCNALSAGHIEIAKWCIGQCCLESKIITRAWREKQIDFIKLCVEKKCPWPNDFISKVIKTKNKDFFVWCVKNQCPWEIDSLNMILKWIPDLFVWAVETGCPFGKKTMEKVAESGDLEMLMFCQGMSAFFTDKIMSKAALSGNVNMLIWCCENGFVIPDDICFFAAKSGNINALMWCYNYKQNLIINNKSVIQIAIEDLNMDIFSWCLEKECYPDDETIEDLSNLYCRKCHISNSRSNSDEIKDIPIIKQMLKIIFSINIKFMDFSSKISLNLAKSGDLELFLICLKSGCILHHSVPIAVAYKSHIHVLSWLNENGLIIKDIGPKICYSAARSGNIETIKYCKDELQLDWDSKTILNAVISGNLEMLIWCVEKGCEWNDDVFKKAGNEGHIEILRWLIKNRKPFPKKLFININDYDDDIQDIMDWAELNQVKLYIEML